MLNDTLNSLNGILSGVTLPPSWNLIDLSSLNIMNIPQNGGETAGSTLNGPNIGSEGDGHASPDFPTGLGPVPDTRAYEGVEAVNILRIFICTIGLIANVTVIALVLILKDLKKGITVWYILQLAIADTLFLITLPFEVLQERNGAWTLPLWLCKAKESIMYINYYTTICFLTVMALDRYIAICHWSSERLQRLRSRKAAYIITFVVWAVCILITIPTMMTATIKGMKPGCICSLDFDLLQSPEASCADDSGGLDFDNCVATRADAPSCIDLRKDVWPLGNNSMFADYGDPAYDYDGDANASNSNTPDEQILHMGCHYQTQARGFKIFIIVNSTVMFLLPLFVIAICYALIIKYLCKRSFRTDSGTSANHARNRKRVIYMCVTLVLVFLVCWLPYHAQHVAKFVGMPGRSSSFCARLTSVTSTLVYLNSAINPFIYFIIARLKSYVRNISRSRAASAVLVLFSRNGQGDRTMTTRQTTRSEKSKSRVGSTTEAKPTTADSPSVA